ncbi:MAG: Hsp70 family protein, partial [Cetobacterium sp.]
MERSVGIDLGTTNTVISYIDKKGKIKVLKFGRNVALPSAIYFETKNDIIFGEPAIEKGFINPKALARNFKPLMGTKDKIDVVAENGDKFSLTAKELSKRLLNMVFNKATEKMLKEFPGDYVGKVVITVPSKFSPNQKADTKWAAMKAGIEEVKLVSESTAAAIAYASENELHKKVLVYDFGGGTFDVSIIEKKGERYVDAVTPGGDKNLGGNLLTKEIMNFIFEKIEEDLGIELPLDEDDFDEDDYSMTEDIYRKNLYNIYAAANSIKEALSEVESLTVPLEIYKTEEDYKVLSLEFNRKRLMILIGKYIEKTIKILDNTIN